MTKKVTTIPALLNKQSTNQVGIVKKRRVAAYARVSTDQEEQLTSYEAQVDYYTNYIKSRDDWEFVDVYTDEGISGTSTKHREGFNKMVKSALDGNIDLIITKSVSRFARNTVDSLTTIRKLKDIGCECYFEKENIWTFDGKGELLLTIMSSLAQEESRSISENVKWGHRKRFADGKVSVPFNNFLGYKKGEDGNLVIDEEQAMIVKRIYREFLSGSSSVAIAKGLTNDGIETPGHKQKWYATTVRSILTNEKYKGDALLQKHYTVDFLTKKQKINNGEVQQYYVENNHPAIIEPDVFEMVRLEIDRRLMLKGKYSGTDILTAKIRCGECGGSYGAKVWHSNDKYRRVMMMKSKRRKKRVSAARDFSSMIICGDCGECYGSKVWHSNSKYKKIIYRCNAKYNGEKKCNTPAIDEERLKEIFVEAINILLIDKDEIIDNINCLLDIKKQCKTYADEIRQAAVKVENIEQVYRKIINDQKSNPLPFEEYEMLIKKYGHEYDNARESYNALIEDNNLHEREVCKLEEFIHQFEHCDKIVLEYDYDLMKRTTESIVVNTDGTITINFIGEQNITLKI